MILSVSRRTDIPNYYAEWFLERVKEGFLYVRNPMNAHQISKISLSPETVDCMVFWTKDPEPMLERLEELASYPFYFQFTLNGYGADVEPGIPDRDRRISSFQKLSRKIGPDKVVWRYDPILLSSSYTPEYHLNQFREIAGQLRGFTDTVVISFVDAYAKTRRAMEQLGALPISQEEMYLIAGGMADIARESGMAIESCAEQTDLSSVGVAHGSCIDKRRIERLLGCRIDGKKDRNQREACGCLESVDVGAYHTCKNGCRYCYATFSESRAAQQIKAYDLHSPLLCGHIGPDSILTERKLKTLARRD